MLALAPDRRPVAFRRMVNRTAPKRLTEQQALGLALRRLRKQRDMTQAQAGEVYGVVEATWRRYEKGSRDLSFEKLEAVARAVGADRDALLAIRAEILGGHLREPTVERVETTAVGEVLLCPRSSNPRWRDPIRINAEGMSEEHDEVRVRGLVLSSIRRFPT